MIYYGFLKILIKNVFYIFISVKVFRAKTKPNALRIPVLFIEEQQSASWEATVTVAGVDESQASPSNNSE
jgi:hypothetical protein